ncbi:MAG: hypothetical protein IMW89_05755 [Ktedonobacteraceae bacterium]|nr:hypothetical protein [Ktedonobacteraceae bacterium]
MRKKIILLLLVFLVVLVSTVSWLLMGAHQSYVYSGPEFLDSDGNSLETLSVRWKITAGPVKYAFTPDAVLLEAKLVGPFKDVDELLNWSRTSDFARKDAPPVVASASPIKTDNWTNKPQTSVLIIPAGTPAGIYDLYHTVSVQSFTGSKITRFHGIAKINCPANGPCH